MATLNKADSQMADKSGDPLLGDRQANVADPGAITSVTNGITDTYTAPTPAQGVTVTSVAATDLDTAAAALELLGGEVDALATDAALLEDEVTALRVSLLACLDVLEEHGLMTAS